jgi:hypothetical protein
MPFVAPQWFDNNGAVAASHQLFFYIAGTTTKQDTYSDQARTVANANPVVLDSSGRATIFLLDASYKVVLASPTDTDPPASPIWTRDNVSSIPFYNINTTIADGSATAAAWGTSDNTLQLTVPKHPVVVSCIFDTPTDAINIPAGTMGANDDCIICEWEADYFSATLSARAAAFGTNIDLGSGVASTLTIARAVFHRQIVSAVKYTIQVDQGAGNTATAFGNLTGLDLDNTAYTIALTMASGSFNIRGHRILYIPALTDWTA